MGSVADLLQEAGVAVSDWILWAIGVLIIIILLAVTNRVATWGFCDGDEKFGWSDLKCEAER
jgi:hypothetical protein